MCNHCHHSHNSKNEHKNESLTLIRISIAFLILLFAVFSNIPNNIKICCFLFAYLLAGYDILYTAIKNIIKGRIFDENFLMGLATLGALAIKEYPEAVMVMVLYQLGEYFQHRAVKKSRRSILELMDIRPDYAYKEENGKIIKYSPEEINTGDIILVKTGEKIPLDGVITEGSAILDTSALTGESVPKTVKIGDTAISGCINTNGVIKIKVTKKYGESTVSKILKLIEHASSKKSRTENFITRFAGYYTPAVVAAALMLAVLPPLLLPDAQFSIWLKRALTFLVISCPCALVISIPLGFFGGIGGASKCGILIKGSNYLEALSKPDSVVFDKTGTLTKGSFEVTKISPQNGISGEQLVEYAAYAENYSNHPIALSLKKAYKKDIDTSKISNVSEFAGNGVKADINGEEILAGNSALMEKFQINIPEHSDEGTVVYCAKNGEYIGYIVISDEIKEDSPLAIKELKKVVGKTVMLTGDSEAAAKRISERLGIQQVYSQLLPQDKVEKLENIIAEKQKDKNVIFIGDGINDAPVLTRADVGIAMGAMGSDAAIEAADVVIMDDKPSKIYNAVKIAQKTMLIVKQNIIFALGVKALFLLLGAFGFMTMWGAVFADVGVALLAVLNSLRSLRVKNIQI
ncbi:MAG TPA: cadmium-translocating P-type ATPase [Candidatus Adamsella sp.]|nr:cadmium-translocating P-type ATPase [Candidatus Adamsella sp.]